MGWAVVYVDVNVNKNDMKKAVRDGLCAVGVTTQPSTARARVVISSTVPMPLILP